MVVSTTCSSSEGVSAGARAAFWAMASASARTSSSAVVSRGDLRGLHDALLEDLLVRRLDQLGLPSHLGHGLLELPLGLRRLRGLRHRLLQADSVAASIRSASAAASSTRASNASSAGLGTSSSWESGS